MMHTYITPLSDLVRRLQAAGHSQRAIAEHVGVDQSTICRIATGATKSISFEAGQRLLELAGGKVVLPPDEPAGANRATSIMTASAEVRDAA